MGHQTLADWLATRPFTLTLSSGFFSFFAHCGLVSVLQETGLIPAAVSGSSAGALVGSCWASGCSAEEIKELLFALERTDFWDPAPGPGYLRGRRFRNLVAGMVKVPRIEQCPIPLAISVYDGFARRTRVLKQGDLAPSVVASCAVPLLFQPVRLEGRLYWDGGIADRPGICGAPPGPVFYHHILSRSPWRRRGSKALQIPSRRDLQALAIPNLPRVGPNSLHQGKRAYALARSAAFFALDQPIRHHQADPVQAIDLNGWSPDFGPNR